jgi:hypothetical protein
MLLPDPSNERATIPSGGASEKQGERFPTEEPHHPFPETKWHSTTTKMIYRRIRVSRKINPE